MLVCVYAPPMRYKTVIGVKNRVYVYVLYVFDGCSPTIFCYLNCLFDTLCNLVADHVDRLLKLVAMQCIILHCSAQRTGHGRAGGLCAAALHARMNSLDHDTGAKRLQHGHNLVCNLIGQPLLHLQSLRISLHHACKLTESQDTLAGNVRNVDVANEWEQVMFAHAGKGNVADDHAGVAVVGVVRNMRFIIKCCMVGRHGIPMHAFQKRLDVAMGRVRQALAIHV